VSIFAADRATFWNSVGGKYCPWCQQIDCLAHGDIKHDNLSAVEINLSGRFNVLGQADFREMFNSLPNENGGNHVCYQYILHEFLTKILKCFARADMLCTR
jgi:hypothetical protein